ncbi:aldose 1-epimerase family protein [Novosphingobium flavum]|uniref:Aldose 1-epimerase family protein n=1 Tax=Novosphingobium flavum TaxID=1778672 RepID=A0A7X1FV24_9SPHN|nr:aldose 1-epimerase family protein [Novosphingobium flavum]
MTELVTIASERLTARINPLGAELWSLCDADGREYMTDADPAFWTGHAPLLFPVVGALRHGCYRIGERTYQLSKHGFARTSRFDLTETGADFARFCLMDSEETRAVYPFPFVLTVEYRAEGDVLREVVTVSNRGAAAMWFSLGFHPAFAWPLPGGAGKADHRVIFAEDEPAPVRRIDPASGLVLPDPEPSPALGRVLAPTAAVFEPDVVIWDRLASRSASFGAERGGRVELGFPDTPMLGIWQKPGAAYLCIEPWQGIADPEGWEGDFRFKPGVVELDPGASRSFRMDVRLVPG